MTLNSYMGNPERRGVNAGENSWWLNTSRNTATAKHSKHLEKKF